MDSVLHGNPITKASIDMACYDIIGKGLKLPVSTLLGGTYRDKIPLVESIGVQSPEKMSKEAVWVLERGFEIKLKFGVNPWEDLERLRIVRDAVGKKARIRADANGGYTSVAICIQALKEMEKYNLNLLEQPVGRYDLYGMAELCKELSMPICADESVFSPQDAMNVIKNKAADVIDVKVGKAGGFF